MNLFSGYYMYFQYLPKQIGADKVLENLFITSISCFYRYLLHQQIATQEKLKVSVDNNCFAFIISTIKYF